MGKHKRNAGGGNSVGGILNPEGGTQYIIIDCVGRTPVRGDPAILEHDDPIRKQRREIEIVQQRSAPFWRRHQGTELVAHIGSASDEEQNTRQPGCSIRVL